MDSSGNWHVQNCACWQCVNKRNMLWTLNSKFEQSDLTAPPRGRVLHKIGKVTLQMYIYRKHRHYEVLYEDKLIAQARDWLQDALHKARSKIPKPTAKVQGELLAYRGWSLIGDLLSPLTRLDDYDTWSGPVAFVPRMAEGYTDGLYAVKFTHAKELIRVYTPTVHGIVGLSGKVIEYEFGYRAQRQVIRVLRVVPPVGDAVIKSLEDRYQCQVFRVKNKANDPF